MVERKTARHLAICGAAVVAAAVAVVVDQRSGTSPDAVSPFVRHNAPDPVVEVIASEAPTTPAPELSPTIDTLRVEPDGLAVIAGRAAPDSQVAITVDGVPQIEAMTGVDGTFAALGDIPPSDIPRVVSVETRSADGTLQASTPILIAPTVPSEPPTVRTTPPTPAAETALALPEQSDRTSDGLIAAVTPDTLPELAAPIAPAAPLALRLTAAGPAPVPVSAVTDLQLDTISYDDSGGVRIAGRTPAGIRALRVSVGEAAPVTLELEDGGSWNAALPDLQAGTYSLQIEAIAEDGEAAHRITTPFRREDPDRIVALSETSSNRVTVQSGNSLWKLAEGAYGDGFMYIQIFEANADQIRDPDLIFPGQVFAVPDESTWR